MYFTSTDSDGDKVIVQNAVQSKIAVSCEKSDGDFITVLLTRKQMKELVLSLTDYLIG